MMKETVAQGLAPAEAPSKVRLKFRVSAFDSVSGDKVRNPRWTEKWGVGLSGLEEFHVTDHLLKLPFLENPPKTVCVFTVSSEGLKFHMRDSDRISQVNRRVKTEAVIRKGDQIQIGETLTIEVLQAPEADVPTDTYQIPEIDDTKTQAPSRQEDGPTLTLTAPKGGQLPIFAEVSKSIEIEEPLMDRTIPVNKPSPAPASAPSPPRTVARPTAVLAGLSQKSEGIGPDGAPLDSLYPPEPKLDAARPTLSERLLALVSKVLRRDELQPAQENFPLDDFNLGNGGASGNAQGPEVRSNAFLPAEPKVELDLRPAEKTVATDASAWIPEAEPKGARMRGRAVVFVLSALITVAVAAIAYDTVQKWADRQQSAEEATSVATIKHESFDKGIPIEFIQEKVRKMRRGR